MEASKQNSWSLRGALGFSKVEASSNVVTATPKPKTQGKEYEADRYRHDLAQADAMRRGKREKAGQLAESDILLGLNGLDEADSLREAGKFQQAMKISEMAMELLIEFLKSDKSVLPAIDRSTISNRVQVALTDAEAMKTHLDPFHVASNSNKPDRATSRELSGDLAAAIKKSRASPSASGRQAAGQPTSSRPLRGSPQNSTVPQIWSSSSPPTTTTPKNWRTKVNNRDPMVQVIKSELYVDQSQLQGTSWDDIAGLETAKQALQENAILPLARPDLFTGLRKPRNILLYGPPGTGKTMLVKAVAKESRCLLFICTASSLTSKWHGEGEKLLRTLFQVARAAAPSIIFIDEMDALLSNRKSDGEHEASRRFKTEFMTQVDGIQNDGCTSDSGEHVLVIGCTNCPWDVDPAVLRRLPRRIYIPLPDTATRTALLKKLLAKAGSHNLRSADIKAIVKQLRGFSGSDISSIASEASFGPIRSLGGVENIRGAKASDIRPLSRLDFENAISQSTRSVSKPLQQKYDDWKQEQGASS